MALLPVYKLHCTAARSQVLRLTLVAMRGFRLAGLLFLIALVLFLWKDHYMAPPHSQKKALIYTSHSKAQAVCYL